MDNGRRFFLCRSLTHQERFELRLEIGEAMGRWSVKKAILLDPKAKRISVAQPEAPAVGRKRTAHPAVSPFRGEPLFVSGAEEWHGA